MPLSVAIVGAGPAGFYAAEAVLSCFPEAEIAILERWPTPFGLVRFGVAPDHLSTKNVTRLFEKTLSKNHVRFLGNVSVGRDVTYVELKSMFDLVVLSNGMGRPRMLDIPGEDIKGVIPATDFVGWYNSLPGANGFGGIISDANAAVVVGNGNVALDIARLLAKSDKEFINTDIDPQAGQCLATSNIKDIYVVGRRGPSDANFSFPELSELGDLERAEPIVDGGLFPIDTENIELSVRKKKERNLRILESFSQQKIVRKDVRIHLLFCASPVKVLGEKQVVGIEMVRNEVVGGKARPTSEKFSIKTDIVCPAIGYHCEPIDGVPYAENVGSILNQEGRVDEGVCVVGWARRGSNGVIGTNRVDAREVIEKMSSELVASGKPGTSGLCQLLVSRDVDIVDTVRWRAIDLAETGKAVGGRPRIKFNSVQNMLAV